MTGRMGRAGAWGGDGVREVTSPATWQKARRWAALAREGRLPDGTPNRDGHQPRVFCASLADVFEDRPELVEPRFRLFELVDETPELAWLMLTKRPDLARDFLETWYVEHGVRTGRWTSEWVGRDGLGWGCPPNVWLGASIENSRFTWRADVLREVPAAVRFVSAEPLLGSLFRPQRLERCECGHDGPPMPGTTAAELRRLREPHYVCPSCHEYPEECVCRVRKPLDLTGIDWLIAGGESGGRESRPPHPSWLRELRDACAEHDVAFHSKQWGSWTPDPAGTARDSVWVAPDGRVLSDLAADATGLPDGSARMRYAGAAPTSGGKRLDGVDHCAFPREYVAA